MKALLNAAVVFLMCLSFAPGAMAAERGTPEEAVALVQKAVAYLKANGKEKAYAEFNNPNGQFKDRDLYIFVIDMTGLEWANGANQKIVGKNVLDLKDAEGKTMVKSFIELAKGKGKGWVDYKWPNPIQKTVESKSTYLEKYEDVLVASGIYK
ncbi:cache domain-containing protein [Pseudoduganella namucuonensis]|uniref:Single Cache domain 2-containing protein n=1 Tax=Pseudoduganella namucuonensis TaxID=1035707 RepID=A0A1I7ETV6_9BURK|nr:cache domain-containing protein [Pseudoduganella namucuonensis]SFU27333.1 Single Cache domain 2-containing protein [Pseudoduganella namucuonensis]